MTATIEQHLAVAYALRERIVGCSVSDGYVEHLEVLSEDVSLGDGLLGFADAKVTMAIRMKYWGVTPGDDAPMELLQFELDRLLVEVYDMQGETVDVLFDKEVIKKSIKQLLS